MILDAFTLLLLFGILPLSPGLALIVLIWRIVLEFGNIFTLEAKVQRFIADHLDNDVPFFVAPGMADIPTWMRDDPTF